MLWQKIGIHHYMWLLVHQAKLMNTMPFVNYCWIMVLMLMLLMPTMQRLRMAPAIIEVNLLNIANRQTDLKILNILTILNSFYFLYCTKFGACWEDMEAEKICPRELLMTNFIWDYRLIPFDKFYWIIFENEFQLNWLNKIFIFARNIKFFSFLFRMIRILRYF